MKQAIQTAISRAVVTALQKIEAGTCYQSRMSAVLDHDCYAVIVAIGEQAIDTLMKQIGQYPWICMACLHEIVGDDGPTIREEYRGKLDPLKAAWRRWYKNRKGQ